LFACAARCVKFANGWLLPEVFDVVKVHFGVCYLGLDGVLLQEDGIVMLRIEDGGIRIDIVAI
jgi:hypothetical protein